MANYFSIFPKILYSFDDYKNSEYITNILSRFSFEESLKNNFSAYFMYTIKDDETPEIIASKYYDSPNKHWIILMMNDIIDPQFDWPLTYSSLDSYIDVKYMEMANSNTSGAGIDWSKSNNIAYYMTEKTITPDNIITINQYEIDANTYANTTYSSSNLTLENGDIITLEIDKTYKTYYDYEIEQNDSKREIKLLKREFLVPIENEIRKVFE